ncbi:ATP-binding protein [Larkinella sp. C7]|uniref:ATP-binding protein n=1 Tax=Larkinella sp. C7 TaxID=2576607 RepID=UPI0014871A9E|nr:ATP-binding protein [Larkinella sp. C7]
MLRTDYMRVPGNDWVDDPINRFANNVDMRGPLFRMVFRAMNTVADDLPKGFLLPEGELQARYRGLPGRVLREVIVNAFMHQSYKVGQPMQIIRYSNRLEIRNPGFSLKPEDQLGEPGSKPRNRYIAAVFHDTNLAETKGSGIRTMRRLLEEAEMAPPTFESDHSNNEFTARLLLHHFLSEEQLTWLSQFDGLSLNLDQKKALIFLKGVGAINNPTYRQFAGCDTLTASMDLRKLRELGLIEQKGKSTATYYVPASNFELINNIAPVVATDDAAVLTDDAAVLTDDAAVLTDDATVLTDDATVLTDDATVLTDDATVLTDDATVLADDGQNIPETIRQLAQTLGKRTNDRAYTRSVIRRLCEWRALSLNELSRLINRSPAHLFSEYVKPMLEVGELSYTIPDMPKHPNQAYKTSLIA